MTECIAPNRKTIYISIMSKGGARPGAGRKPGIQNAINRQLKETILEALERSHPNGAIGYLIQQSELNPTAFMGLIGKVLPLQIGNADDKPFRVEDISAKDKEILERFKKAER